MKKLLLPYGKGSLPLQLPESRIKSVLESRLCNFSPGETQERLIGNALKHPENSPRLSELAIGKKNIVIIASDHTRPVPSKLIIPAMLKEIRETNPSASITLLIATGCHRGTSKEELIEKFGSNIVDEERIVIHDCDDADQLISLGTLPSGGELIINRIAAEADLLCAEGFIEPHFFAGSSGGRKSILPGVASRKTVLANHCSAFIDDKNARTGILEGNPIHKDMLFAAQKAKLAFIVNVVLNQDKEVVCAVAGDCEAAHLKGVQFLNSWCHAQAAPAEIVISTNGGYPLDQNIYQAVKGMTAAEATVLPGGVIIMLAKSNDGHGGDVFFKTFQEEPDVNRLMESFLSTPADQTIPDQWQSQIFARVLKKARIVYVSDAPNDMVCSLHMIPAHSLEEALDKADQMLGHSGAEITVIPDGVSVIVT